MVAIKQIWFHALNLGIEDTMPFLKKRSIKATNMIGMLGFPIPLAFSVLIVSLTGFSWVIIITGFFSSVSTGLMPIFNRLGKYQLGMFIQYSVLTFGLLANSAVLGGGFGIEYVGFYMLIGSFAFTQQWVAFRWYVAMSALLVGGSIVLYYFIGFHSGGNFIIQFLFATSSLVYGYLILDILKSQTEDYEKMIKEKNDALVEQTKQLELQHESMSKLNSAIREKNRRVGQKNHLITDSLNYARRIQLATLPTPLKLQSLLGDSFVFFKPKDIVSGDFYWAEYHEGRLYFAVADCTGHGVPGAFMSLLGINALRQIIREPGCKNPSCILSDIYERIAEQLGSGLLEESMLHEGMDITLCELDKTNGTLRLSLAGRSAYFVRDCQVTEFKGTRAHIRKNNSTVEKFEDHELQLKEGDTLYLFTDGYTDQFDFNDKRRYSLGRLKNLLPEIFYVDMDAQLELIRNEFENWKGHTPQTDDILVMGIRFTT